MEYRPNLPQMREKFHKGFIPIFLQTQCLKNTESINHRKCLKGAHTYLWNTHKMDRSTRTECISGAIWTSGKSSVRESHFVFLFWYPPFSSAKPTQISYLFRGVQMNLILYEPTNLNGLCLQSFQRHPYKVHGVWPILVPMSEFMSSGSEFMW